MNLGEALPEFAEELEKLLVVVGRSDLVEQVRGLPILGRCPCGDEYCSSFYTGERERPFRRSTVDLYANEGFILLDLVGNTSIVQVEVLDRPDVKEKLDVVMGETNG